MANSAHPRVFRPVLTRISLEIEAAANLFSMPKQKLVRIAVQRMLAEIGQGEGRGELDRDTIGDQVSITVRVPSPLDDWLWHCHHHGATFCEESLTAEVVGATDLALHQRIYLLDVIDGTTTNHFASVWYSQPEALRGWPHDEETPT